MRPALPPAFHVTRLGRDDHGWFFRYMLFPHVSLMGNDNVMVSVVTVRDWRVRVCNKARNRIINVGRRMGESVLGKPVVYHRTQQSFDRDMVFGKLAFGNAQLKETKAEDVLLNIV